MCVRIQLTFLNCSLLKLEVGWMCVCVWSCLYGYPTDLLELRLTEDGGRVETDPLLLDAHEGGALAVHMQQVGVHACNQCRFHHRPVLRVQVHVTDVPTTTRTHKTLRMHVQINTYMNTYLHQCTAKSSTKCIQLLSVLIECNGRTIQVLLQYIICIIQSHVGSIDRDTYGMLKWSRR